MELEKLREVVNHELRQREIQPVNESAPMTDGGWRSRRVDPAGFNDSMASAKSMLAGQTANAVPRGLTLDNVEDAFQYHPWHPGQQDRSNQVREALVSAAKVILRNVPDGPDRSVALRKLREVRMDVNSAITHNGRF